MLAFNDIPGADTGDTGDTDRAAPSARRTPDGRTPRPAAGLAAALTAIAFVALVAGCTPAAGPATSPHSEPSMTASSASSGAHAADVDAWHAARLATLQSEDGWLSLVALGWLEPGVNRIARDAGAAVAYAGLPHPELGTIEVELAAPDDPASATVVFRPAPGVTVEGLPDDGRLQTDGGGAPTMLRVGTCRFHVIERGGRLAVRLKDAAAATRTDFRGIDRFPVSSDLRVEATFRPAAAGATVDRRTITGYEEAAEVAGEARFELDGQTFDIILHPGGSPGEYFVVFGDETNRGGETYPGGRFLIARTLPSGRLELDFNRAYNPPCSFTPYATCPLPVAQNRLPLAIRAGERWSGTAHTDGAAS